MVVIRQVKGFCVRERKTHFPNTPIHKLYSCTSVRYYSVARWNSRPQTPWKPILRWGSDLQVFTLLATIFSNRLTSKWSTSFFNKRISNLLAPAQLVTKLRVSSDFTRKCYFISSLSVSFLSWSLRICLWIIKRKVWNSPQLLWAKPQPPPLLDEIPSREREMQWQWCSH